MESAERVLASAAAGTGCSEQQAFFSSSAMTGNPVTSDSEVVSDSWVDCFLESHEVNKEV